MGLITLLKQMSNQKTEPKILILGLDSAGILTR